MGAKIEDVAKAAGVSIMSVSRAMRGVEGVSEKTRARIEAEARRLGYQPSRLAGALTQENSTLIGVSVPTLFDAVFAEILDGMGPTLTAAGLETVIETTDYDAAREQAFVDRMSRWSPAAIILTGVDHSEEVRKRLRSTNCPVMEIWDMTDDPIDLCVGIDHFEAGRKIGAAMVQRGYRRPAFVASKGIRDRRAERRETGFANAFTFAGVEQCRSIRAGGLSQFEIGFAGAEQAMEQGADLVYFLNDHLAFGGLMAVAAKGARCPEDVGIVGFNGLRLNEVLPRRMTTAITPRKVMGATAARRLVARINGVEAPKVTQLPVEIEFGETTR